MTGSQVTEQEKEHATAVMVSVVIVSWNAREYLLQCLASLDERTCRYPMELIVVDNASSDGSPEAVASWYPRVQLIRNSSNLGFAKANNLGIAASSGRYICLVNSDVKVLPDCITRLVNYCEEHPEAGMAGPRIIGRDGKLQRSCRGFPGVWNMLCRALALDSLVPRCRLFTGYSLRHWAQDSLRLVDILTGCFWLVRRRALEQAGLLDESFFMYGEDMDWCKRFRDKGWRVMFVPSAEALHYGGGSSSNAPVRFYIERHRADLHYWEKHHSRPVVFCFFLICCLHLVLRALGYSLAFVIKSRERATYGSKAKRSVACLKWMLSDGIRQWTWASAPGVAGGDGVCLERNVTSG
jgi:GT2 family glycosyltransferase